MADMYLSFPDFGIVEFCIDVQLHFDHIDDPEDGYHFDHTVSEEFKALHIKEDEKMVPFYQSKIFTDEIQRQIDENDHWLESLWEDYRSREDDGHDD